MQKQTLFFFLLLSVLIAGCTSDTDYQMPSTTIQGAQPYDTQFYDVVKVVDGDTIWVDYNGTIEKVRLIGIDTPETVHPSKPLECFGLEASNFAKEILGGGAIIKLEADPTQDNRDKYKRLLRYVFLENGTNFNQLLISEGFAREYTYKTPYKYQSQFKQAEIEAKENLRGLWGACS
ncbi:MAG TPA: thermonuclease family protein [archaeon]|nr:thermonuclease family protein [archaeon]